MSRANRTAAQVAQLERRLRAFGVPAREAARIAAEWRMPRGKSDRYGKGWLNLPTFGSTLAIAEWVVSVLTNYDRPYHVDTTRVAMGARV